MNVLEFLGGTLKAVVERNPLPSLLNPGKTVDPKFVEEAAKKYETLREEMAKSKILRAEENRKKREKEKTSGREETNGGSGTGKECREETNGGSGTGKECREEPRGGSGTGKDGLEKPPLKGRRTKPHPKGSRPKPRRREDRLSRGQWPSPRRGAGRRMAGLGRGLGIGRERLLLPCFRKPQGPIEGILR
ncbi:MAG: hypothetical protein LBQ79_10820 [Deltaproteobacteria bacterium]|nr:hypothetical protein [Deltaproteobacteria bacterium]